MICTFECTWCTPCVEVCLSGTCPNCSGNLQPRPVRPTDKLVAYPASSKRVNQKGLHKE